MWKKYETVEKINFSKKQIFSSQVNILISSIFVPHFIAIFSDNN